MSTIDPRASVLAALQARLSPLRRAVRTRAPAAAATSGAGGASAVAVAQRLAAIDRADPDRRRKAVRVVLEEQLAREFGCGALNDPAWPAMLEAVQQQMQADAQAAAAVEALGDLLLRAPA